MIEKLKCWSHKIIPLIYDDSLSYYETLCKIKEKINEIIEYFNEGRVGKVIWKNNNPSSDVAELWIEDVIINQSDTVVIEYWNKDTKEIREVTMPPSPEEPNRRITLEWMYPTSNAYLARRVIQYMPSSYLIIIDESKNQNLSTGISTTDNSKCIPLLIYVKKNLRGG